MEKGEEEAQKVYKRIRSQVPEAEEILHQEEIHEEKILNLINEELLKYVSLVVLGLNDALVELTGALAGLTLALQSSRLIAAAGLITGVAASFSMAASEYLSIKSEKSDQDPKKAAFYTGTAYILTVAILILPYFLFTNVYLSLVTVLIAAIVIILFFNFYIAVATDVSFKKRFTEMVFLSLGVSSITFLFGLAARLFLKIDV